MAYFIYIFNSMKTQSTFNIDMCSISQSKIRAVRYNIAIVGKVIANTNEATVVKPSSVYKRVPSDFSVSTITLWELFGASAMIVHTRRRQSRTTGATNHKLLDKIKETGMRTLIRNLCRNVLVNGLRC
jgi:hypothetical protein